jgi:hypothetical protein
MDGERISYLMSMDEYTTEYWRGLAAQDTEGYLGVGTTLPALYILNTDIESGDGKHWCAAYIDRGRMEFFDSYGFPPMYYGLQRLFPSGQIYFNAMPVQSIETFTCGYHCLFFSHYRARQCSMSDILMLYDATNLKKNDEMVSSFVQQFGKSFDLKVKRG